MSVVVYGQSSRNHQEDAKKLDQREHKHSRTIFSKLALEWVGLISPKSRSQSGKSFRHLIALHIFAVLFPVGAL
jgi:hypothetical protein